jgi:hypothetical protein
MRTTNNKQQTTNNKQQTTNNNQQPTTNNQQPTTNNQQPTTINHQLTLNYLILIFQTTHRTLLAEKTLLAKGVKLDVIPTPKEISSDCGMAIRINEQITCREIITQILNSYNIEFKIYEKWMQ